MKRPSMHVASTTNTRSDHPWRLRRWEVRTDIPKKSMVPAGHAHDTKKQKRGRAKRTVEPEARSHPKESKACPKKAMNTVRSVLQREMVTSLQGMWKTCANVDVEGTQKVAAIVRHAGGGLHHQCDLLFNNGAVLLHGASCGSNGERCQLSQTPRSFPMMSPKEPNAQQDGCHVDDKWPVNCEGQHARRKLPRNQFST